MVKSNLFYYKSGYSYFLLTVFLAIVIIAKAVKKKKSKNLYHMEMEMEIIMLIDSRGEKKKYIITDYLLGIGFWVLALASAS